MKSLSHHNKEHKVDPVPETVSILYVVHYVRPTFQGYYLEKRFAGECGYNVYWHNEAVMKAAFDGIFSAAEEFLNIYKGRMTSKEQWNLLLFLG